MKRYQLDGLGFQLRGVSATSQFLAPIFASRDYEMLVVALLDSCCGVLQLLTFDGDKNRLDVKFSSILKEAVTAGANALLLAHNHPSGDEQPSRADKIFTRSFVLASEALDLTIVDHLVFGEKSAFSFRQNSLL